MRNRVAAVLYDKQVSGEKFMQFRKSLKEVVNVLQGERKR